MDEQSTELELRTELSVIKEENAVLENEVLSLQNELIEQALQFGLFTEILDSSSVALVVINKQCLIVHANLEAKKLIEEVEGVNNKENFKLLLNSESSYALQQRMASRDRTSDNRSKVYFLKNNHPCLISVNPLSESYDDLIALTIELIDFHGYSDQSFRLAKLAFEQLNEALMVTNQDNVIVSVNRSFEEITGYQQNEVIGKTPTILSSGRHNPEFYGEMYRRLNTDGAWAGEIWNRRKNGTVYPEWLQITKVFDSLTGLKFYISSFSDISDRKNAKEHLDRLAFFDPLTSLPNRSSLANQLESLLRRTELSEVGSNFTVLFVDLDDFKNVNDQYGHDEGDLILKEAAQRITSTIRQMDFAARIGGDEFVIILQRLKGRKEAVQIIEKLLERLAEPFIKLKGSHTLSASIGAAFFPDHGEQTEELMRKADLAMYSAKAKGKNNYALFDRSMEEQALMDTTTLKLLNKAIENPQTHLEVHYQPVVNLMDQSKLVGFECLVRLKDDLGNIVFPDDFIEIAEKKRLINDLGMAIFEQVCRDKRRYQDLQGLEFAINLSPIQFTNPTLLEDLEQASIAHDQRFESFSFEMTETATIENLGLILKQLNLLREKGHNVLLDDFGTGYASLSMLKDLPTNIIKVDRSFIMTLFDSSETQKLVSGLIAMAKALNLEIVAEGIETEQHQLWLAEQGVEFGQGYHIGKPKPLKDYVAMIREGDYFHE